MTFVAGTGDLGDGYQSVVNAAIATPGSGYTAGQTLNLGGGTYSFQASLTVDTVNASGGITSVSIGNYGTYTAAPSNPVPLLGGSGSGATFDLTFADATDNQAGYPADSPYVIAVGGTRLSVQASGAYGSEVVWNDASGATGGGISNYETEPTYQQGLAIYNENNVTMRAAPDVAFDASSFAGGMSYNSEGGGWWDAGGTSYATPCWAGLVAIADQIRANVGETTLSGGSQTLPILYSLENNPSSYSQDFHQITSGNNGEYYANPNGGYNLATGIGTPIANTLVPALADVNQLLYAPVGGTNNLTLSESNGILDLYDNGTLVAYQPANVTTSVVITAGGAVANPTDNSLMIDYSGGVFNIPISFDGGDGTGNHALTITGAPRARSPTTPPGAAPATSWSTARPRTPFLLPT